MTITQDELDAGLSGLMDTACDILVTYNQILVDESSADQDAAVKGQSGRTALQIFGKQFLTQKSTLLSKIADTTIRAAVDHLVETEIMHVADQTELSTQILFFDFIQTQSGAWFSLVSGTFSSNGAKMSVVNGVSIKATVLADLKKKSIYTDIVLSIKVQPTAVETPLPASSNNVVSFSLLSLVGHKILQAWSPEYQEKSKNAAQGMQLQPKENGFTPDTFGGATYTVVTDYLNRLLASIFSETVDPKISKKQTNTLAADIVSRFNKKPEAQPYLELERGAKETTPSLPDTVTTTMEPEQIQADINAQDQIIRDADTAMQLSNGVNTPAYKLSFAKKKEAQEKKAALTLQLNGKLVVTNASSNKEAANNLAKKNEENNVKAGDIGGGDKETGKGGAAVSGGAAPKVEIDSSVFDDSPKVLDLGLKLTFDDPVSRRYFELNTTNPTQLFVEDPIDFRSVQMVKPFFTSGHTSSYFRLMNDPLTAKPAEFINSGKEQPTLKNPFGSGAIYNQFFIKRLDETHSEKFQLTDTISSGQALFSFGEKPEFWTIQGQLINDSLNNWLTKFREAWKHYLRISKLVEHGQFLRIALPAIRLTVDCYPVALSLSHADESESISTFSMQFFVKDWTSWSNINLSINDGTTAYRNSMLSMLSLDSKKSTKTANGVTPDSNAQKGGQPIHQVGDVLKKVEVLNPTKKK